MSIKNRLTIFLSISILFVIGCGAGAKGPSPSVSLAAEASSEIIDNIPDWFSDPEEIENTVLGKAEGVSRSKEGARKKAKARIINDFRQKTKAIASGRSEDFFKETGEGADSEIYMGFEEIQTTVWEGAVEGWNEIKSTTVVEKSTDANGRPYNIYRHYILAGIDQNAADKRLLAKIKMDKELKTAFEQTKSYDKLQADLDKYKGKLD